MKLNLNEADCVVACMSYVCLLVSDVAESNSATADWRCSPYTGAGSEDRISPFSAIYARQRFSRRRSSRYRPAPICQCRL